MHGLQPHRLDEVVREKTENVCVQIFSVNVLSIVIAIPEIPISGFPEIPFSPKSRNSGIFQSKIPEIRDFHFLHYLL